MASRKPETILLTGASGFIGSRLARALLDAGKKLILISKSGAIPPGLKKNFRAFKVDIRNKAALKKLPGPIDAVFHTAIHSPQKLEVDSDARLCIETNGLGTLNLLEFCRERGIPRFIYSTSIGVYGTLPKPPMDEAAAIIPASPYGMGKRMGELFCERFHERFGLQHFILRYSSVYGVGQRPDTVLPIFIDRARKGLDLTVFGAGKKKQDFIYVDDVVQANLLALKSNHPGYYQIGSGVGTSMPALARAVRAVFSGGRKIKIVRNASIPEEESRIWLDISKAKKLLRYRPRYDLTTGLKEYLNKL